MRSLMVVLSLLALTVSGLPAGAQGGIVVDGDRVLTGGTSCATGQSLVGFSSDGSALCACLSGREQCTGACVDLDSDAAHCGECDKACSVGAACIDGRCRGCDVWRQDCPSGQACYYKVDRDETLCANDVVVAGQDEPCDASFFNECSGGYGCVLPDAVPPNPPTGNVCALFCDPDVTRSDPDAYCSVNAGADYRCFRAVDVWSGNVGEDVAFCAGPEWFQ